MIFALQSMAKRMSPVLSSYVMPQQYQPVTQQEGLPGSGDTQGMHVTLLSMHITSHSMHLTLHGTHIILYSVHVTLHSMNMTLHSMRVTLPYAEV